MFGQVGNMVKIAFKNIANVLLICLFICLPLASASAHPAFKRTPGLAKHVEFWRLMFTKYGKDNVVFHHREHPQLIYSVLDLSDYATKYEGRQYAKMRQKAVDEEKSRISRALLSLDKGHAAGTALEQHLQKIFRELPGKQKYRLAANLDLIRTQTGIKERFKGGLERSRRYLHAIEKIFADAGLPTELARLPLVESSFDYDAKSSVGAAGIWQFMPSTGRQFMKVDSVLDERRDPIIASRAAVKYLSSAYQTLGTWPLAVTSYNHGVSGVMRAVKATGTSDLSEIIKRYDGASFGFASKSFFVSFLAALEVYDNRFKYFPDLNEEAPLRFDEIVLGRSASYQTVVKLSGLSSGEFDHYNPAFLSRVRRGHRRIPSGAHVKVPSGKGRSFMASLGHGQHIGLDNAVLYALSAPSADQGDYELHRVKRGEALGSIARRYKVDVEDLADLNDISNPSKIRIGQLLKIPDVSGGSEKVRTVAARSNPPKESVVTSSSRDVIASSYTIKKGDSISSIASRTGVSAKRLIATNNLSNPHSIRVGQTLKIPGSESVTKVVAQVHTVKKGDTLSGIAKSYGVSLKSLSQQNGIRDPRSLRPGQTLKIPVKKKIA